MHHFLFLCDHYVCVGRRNHFINLTGFAILDGERSQSFHSKVLLMGPRLTQMTFSISAQKNHLTGKIFKSTCRLGLLSNIYAKTHLPTSKYFCISLASVHDNGIICTLHRFDHLAFYVFLWSMGIVFRSSGDSCLLHPTYVMQEHAHTHTRVQMLICGIDW